MTKDKVLERVRLLLDRAQHPNTPAPEAELCFSQANKLMAKHAIDELTVRAAQTESERVAPANLRIALGNEGVGEFWPMLRTVLGEVAQTNRCRAVLYQGSVGAEVFGMQDDVSWVEMLYTSIYFSFISQVNPRWNTELGYDHNVYNFKVAGYKWADINKVAMQFGEESRERMKTETFNRWNWTTNTYEDVTETWGTGFYGKMLSAYKRHAKRVGDDNIVATTSFAEYRHQFSDAFATQISRRLRRMADESKQEQDTIPGAALALVDWASVIDESMYKMFPQLRPRSDKEVKEAKARQAMQLEKERQEREAMLAAMSDSERYEFLEKEQRKERREARKNQRYWDDQAKRHNSSAHARGRSVANSVDLKRPNAGVKTTAQRKELK